MNWCNFKLGWRHAVSGWQFSPAPPSFAPRGFSPPCKGGGVGMGQDFSPASRGRAGMGLDFLDPPRPTPSRLGSAPHY